MRNIQMRQYTISEAAKELGVQRNTLYNWIRHKQIPAPKEVFVSDIRVRVWTETQMVKLKEYKASSYWGKGIDRRTGKKTRQIKQ
jgi:transposase-like protein